MRTERVRPEARYENMRMDGTIRKINDHEKVCVIASFCGKFGDHEGVGVIASFCGKIDDHEINSR